MKSRLQEINDKFKRNGIILKEELDDSKKYIMQDSVTNGFMKVEDVNGNKYLVRINGKLWPPFTRESENYNLNQLRENNIDTKVIVNNNKLGYQICHLSEENNKFSEVTMSKKSDSINKIARKIKKFHRIGDFKNHYPIAGTIDNSLKRVPAPERNKLSTYHMLILSMLDTINSDQKNMVSAHNDLLPSSIYIEINKISFVDWEYSAQNHRSYDLALLSIKSSLSPEEEKKLISAYDSNNDLDIQYSVSIMKPIVNYLLLVWNISSKQPNVTVSSFLVSSLISNIQDAIYQHSSKTWIADMKLSFFSKNNGTKKFISNEKSLNNFLTY